MLQRIAGSPARQGFGSILGTLGCGNSGGRRQRRRCGGGIIFAMVAVVCGLFVMTEWRTEKALEVPMVDHTDVIVTEDPGPAAEKIISEPEPPSYTAQPTRKFDDFMQFVKISRDEGQQTGMPVVSMDDQDVTIPSLIIIGAQRAGTSNLFSMLAQHPNVAVMLREDRPEPFMTQDPSGYPDEAEWPGDGLESELAPEITGKVLNQYARPFTLSETRKEDSEEPLMAIELNNEYLASPLAPYRLKMILPDVKVVIVLRDPAERYFSDLRSLLCVEKDMINWTAIDNAFAMPKHVKDYLSEAVLEYSPYDKRCLGEGASADDLWNCHLAAVKTHRPLLQGLYAEQVLRWQRVKDHATGEGTSRHVMVVESREFFDKPEETAASVARFAGLSDHSFFEFATEREASCDPRRQDHTVSSAYSQRTESEPTIRKWYADYNERLDEVLGKHMGWNDRIRNMNVGGGS